jgi:hypothetical protein
MMRAILVVRGVIGLWFAARLAGVPAASLDLIFELLADYLIVDGALGFVMALVLLRTDVIGGLTRERNLAIVLIVDALGRATSGIAVHVWPGIPGFPVTAVLFIGIMAACTGIVGFTEGTLVVEEEVARRGRQHDRPQLAIGPVTLASMASVIFGFASFLFVGEPDYVHALLVAYILAAAVVMFAMSWARRHSHQPAARFQ